MVVYLRKALVMVTLMHVKTTRVSKMHCFSPCRSHLKPLSLSYHNNSATLTIPNSAPIPNWDETRKFLLNSIMDIKINIYRQAFPFERSHVTISVVSNSYSYQTIGAKYLQFPTNKQTNKQANTYRQNTQIHVQINIYDTYVEISSNYNITIYLFINGGCEACNIYIVGPNNF